MTIPHSNASEERIFSLIDKEKTPSRSSLQADDMLSSLLIVKMHIKDLLRWNPSESLIQKAKKAIKYTMNSTDVSSSSMLQAGNCSLFSVGLDRKS